MKHAPDDATAEPRPRRPRRPARSATPRRPRRSDAQDDATLRSAFALLYRLPAPHLGRRERNQLGGYLMPEAPRLVRGVATLLERYGADLPEVDEDPAALRQLQDQADTLGDLRHHLRAVLQRVDEAHLRLQSQAARRAHVVLSRVHHAGQALPPGSPGRHLRQILMARVERLDPRSPVLD